MVRARAGLLADLEEVAGVGAALAADYEHQVDFGGQLTGGGLLARGDVAERVEGRWVPLSRDQAE